MFAVALWDAGAQPPRPRARPLRDQAALLPRVRGRAGLRLRAARASARRDRSRRARGLPRLQLRAGPADDLPRRPEAAARTRPHLGERTERARSGTRGRRRSRRPTSAATRRRSCVEELRARLRDSVRAHLVSDVPVGVLLSGGVDSSMLAALAAEEASAPLRTFSIGFEERTFDELADARLVAERYGTQHRELVLRPDAALLLPALAEAFDEPFADSSALPTYLVSRLAAEDVKVALSGEGGDELFGGYYTYAADLLAERVGGTARFLRPLVERLPSSSARASFDYRAKRFVRAAHLPPLERHHGWKEIFSREARAELTGRRSRARPGRPAPRALRRDRGRRAPGAAPGRRPRHLPRRRPAREDRSRLDGALARGARAVSRPRGHELRARAAEPPQGARTAQEGAAAKGGRAARAARAPAGGASAGSRFPQPRGCAASWSRSRATRSRRTLCAARASSSPPSSPG